METKNSTSPDSKATGNDSAFPTLQPPILHYDGGLTPKVVSQHTAGGLSKREYMATACLQGILANPDCDGTVGEVVEVATNHADTLLARLSAPSPAAGVNDEMMLALRAFIDLCDRGMLMPSVDGYEQPIASAFAAANAALAKASP